MNDHRQEIADNLEQYLIGLDDTFAFKCRNCGKCCKNREDILLNSRDIFNLAIALSLNNEQVINKFCEIYIGEASRFPILRLKPIGTNSACPFFKENKCSVHSLKPASCALFPLGRVVISDAAKENNILDKDLCSPNEVQYILQNSSCGSAKRKQTVRGWLEMFNVPINDSFFLLWTQNFITLSTIMREIEEKPYASTKALDVLRNGILMSLYVDYDTQKDFIEQYESNMSKIHRLLAKLQSMSSKLMTNHESYLLIEY